jgi:hypothetical protein
MPSAKDSPESLPGQPGQGRPKNSKDGQKRKEKVFRPQTGAGLIIWASKAQDAISEIMNPILLEFYKKKNLRSLSASETKEMDVIKTKILFYLDANSKIDSQIILDKFNKLDNNINKQIITEYYSWVKNISNEINTQLSVDDQKQAKASFYSMVYTYLHNQGEE